MLMLQRSKENTRINWSGMDFVQIQDVAKKKRLSKQSNHHNNTKIIEIVLLFHKFGQQGFAKSLKNMR